MNLYGVHGEDDPHKDDAPFKVYLIIAPDEAMARQYAPSNFSITRVEIKKSDLPGGGTAIRCGWVGGAYPLVGES
jgi:hypothetical protein